MRPVDLSDLTEGMRLAKPIYGTDGRLLLGKGVKLTQAAISRLKQMEILFVYIEDEYIGPVEVTDSISESIRLQSLKVLKECTDKIKNKKKLDINLIFDIVNQILDDIGGMPALASLSDIRTKSNHAFNHSVNVCVMAIMTGIVLGYDQLKLKQLGTGALLHDIGKGLLDQTFLQKNEPWTEEEEAQYREHPKLGFDMIRSHSGLSLLIAHTAYQHHERFDGSGFPRGIKGSDIHQFGTITAVVDRFDNLVAPLNPSERVFNHQALQRLVADAGRAFDPEVVKAFLKVITPYPVGLTVQLSTGDIAVVVKNDPNHPSRPKVKLISNKFGIIIHDFPVVDLTTRPKIFIQEVLPERQRPRLKLNKQA